MPATRFDVPAGTTLYIPLTSYDATGASATLTGLAVTDVEIYKNGSTTQRASDAGIALLDTDGIDFDGVTGLHGFSIDLSDNTDAGFWSVGAQYWVVVSSVTIAGQTVNALAAWFRLIEAETTAGRVMAHTAAVSANAINAAAVADGTIDAATFAAGAINAAAIASDAITAAKVADGAIDAATFAAGAINAAAIAADAITAAKIADGAIDAATFAAGAINAAAIANGAIDAATFATDTGFAVIRTGTAQAGASTTITLDSGAVATDDYYNNTLLTIISGTGAGQSRFISDYVGSTKVATVPAWVVTPNNTSVFVISPFGAIAGATAPTASEVAAAVWDRDATGHQTQGTFGQAIGDPGATATSIWSLANTNLNATVSSRASQTSVDTVDDFLDTEIASIISTLGTVNTNVSATQTTLGTVNTNVSSVLTAVDTEVAAILAAVDTEVGAIKTVTDQLVASQAEPTGVPSATATPLQKIRDIHALMVNGVEVNNSTNKLLIKNSSGTTIFEYDIADNGTSTSLSSANAPG